MALETVFSYVRMLVHLPTPEVKCLLIASCQVLETFYIRSVYKNHQNCNFLNGIAFMDYKQSNKFNMVQHHFTPQKITGTDKCTSNHRMEFYENSEHSSSEQLKDACIQLPYE